MFNRLVLSLLVCFVLCGVPCIGQTRKKRSKPRNPSPKRIELIAVVDEHFPEVWKPFTPANGAFSVQFPGEPRDISLEQKDGKVKITTHRFQFVSPNATYEARFVDLPYQIDTPEKLQGILEAVRTDLLDGAKVKPLNESDVLVAGHEGKYMIWKTVKGMLVKAKYFIVGNRIYWLLFGVTDEANLHTDIVQFRDAIATRFFESFKMDAAAGKEGNK